MLNADSRGKHMLEEGYAVKINDIYWKTTDKIVGKTIQHAVF